MLEIVGIILLCMANKKNALARGQKPGKYVAFTVLLWLGLEIVGFLIGSLAQMTVFGSYLLAIVFVGMGAFLSYRLAKGNVQPLYQQPGAVAYVQLAAPVAQPAAIPPVPAADRARLAAAARAVFNNPFSPMVFDPDDQLWKEPVQSEIDVLVRGGAQSLPVLEELLMQCANGGGGVISGSWWYGSQWAVKTAALLPPKESAALMLRLLQKNSNIAEWFTFTQREAAVQIGKIGGAGDVPALRQLLAQPFSMSPVNEIAKAVEQLGGGVPQAPAALLAKAESGLGDEEGMEFLLPLMDETETWEAKDKGFYYYLLAYKAGRLGHAQAARAFYAAQLAANPAPTSFGWQVFASEGVTPSPEAAAQLHGRYPVPRTMGGVRDYTPAAPVPPRPVAEEPRAADPDAMSAPELIDFMATDEGMKMGLGILGMKLSAKLKAGFYDRPQDIEKALRTFGDEGMVARFNMVKSTMRPDDLGLMLPDLLTQYAQRRR